MKNGKISESVLKRSVLKQLHTTSDRILFKPAVGEGAGVLCPSYQVNLSNNIPTRYSYVLLRLTW